MAIKTEWERRMMEAVVTTAAVRRAKIWSNHHQQTNTISANISAELPTVLWYHLIHPIPNHRQDKARQLAISYTLEIFTNTVSNYNTKKYRNTQITYKNQKQSSNHLRRCCNGARHEFIRHVLKLFPDFIMHLLTPFAHFCHMRVPNLKNYMQHMCINLIRKTLMQRTSSVAPSAV